MSLNIFVSYSTKDLEHVSALQAVLSATPINVYVAEYSMPPSVDMSQTIKTAISQADVFVLVWSKNARESEWVLQELGQAVAHQKPILPIVLDTNEKLPLSISSLKYIPAAADPVSALTQARDFLCQNFEARRTQIEAAARAQQEEDNLVKLGLAGLAIWLMTKK